MNQWFYYSLLGCTPPQANLLPFFTKMAKDPRMNWIRSLISPSLGSKKIGWGLALGGMQTTLWSSHCAHSTYHAFVLPLLVSNQGG